MKSSVLLLMCSIAAAMILGCGAAQRDPEAVTQFFRAAKVGNAPDAALMKRREVVDTDQWDHVATIHSMSDDLEICREIAAHLTKGSDQYTCLLLNK